MPNQRPADDLFEGMSTMQIATAANSRLSPDKGSGDVIRNVLRVFSHAQ
jgi:hypothetical protein